MKNIWRPSQGLVIIDLDHNLFAFQLLSPGDKDFMLKKGHWAFDGQLLLLKTLEPNEQPLKIEFNSAIFWILPMNMRNMKFAEHLGNKIGNYVDLDQTDLLIPSKALTICVK